MGVEYLESYFPFYSWYVIIKLLGDGGVLNVIFPFLFLVCYNSSGVSPSEYSVIFPFLFLVCYNTVPVRCMMDEVIFPFLFLVCYNIFS